MLKKCFLALALMAGLSSAHAAGTINYSLSQQLDQYGKPLSGCKLYIIQAGTVSTPQIAYQDSALTIPVAGGSQLTCDASGRLPQFFLADGSIKIRLTDKNGVNQVTADGILVIGPSAGGGGGGGTVDPTTIFQTGAVMPFYGTGVRSGFVRANGRTIGSSSSGATERANSDVQALFEYLWNSDPNLVVSTGRGVSSNADWVANKTIGLPDMRGSALAGLDDMGSSPSGRLTTLTFPTGPTGLGAYGGNEKISIIQNYLPAVSLSFTGTSATISVASSRTDLIASPSGSVSNFNFGTGAGSFGTLLANNAGGLTVNSSGPYTPSGTISGLGNGQAMPLMVPTILMTMYLKL